MNEPDDVHGTAKYDPATSILTIRRIIARYKGKPYEVVTTYGVTVLAPDPAIGCPAVRLTQADGRTYDLIRREYGWTCECRDFECRRANSGKPCKHIAAVLKCPNLLPAAPGDAYEG